MSIQKPEHVIWQERLFYVVIILIIYQMSIYAMTTLSCNYNYIFKDKPISNDKICLATAQDTTSAAKDYITLVLALISKVPENKENERKDKEDNP
ncbi:hypothetical protein SCRM01_049 [Synechococcus phage S-CRM01]|uniref:hypothetical protein n=1 Tax=Synechococcus phage S-CRM01 TaxID=1026955 RepID=UPI000209E35B|nr:hypothetical protein SCRM01_049 [Synechococcus phage S-CRM01]AEC52996.1 hypothetical protein SCRM01_049 [Synechococcus phage S-CRM01]